MSDCEHLMKVGGPERRSVDYIEGGVVQDPLSTLLEKKVVWKYFLDVSFEVDSSEKVEGMEGATLN